MAENSGKLWSDDDTIKLIELYLQDKSLKDLCNHFRRGEAGIIKRLILLGYIYENGCSSGTITYQMDISEGLLSRVKKLKLESDGEFVTEKEKKIIRDEMMKEILSHYDEYMKNLDEDDLLEKEKTKVQRQLWNKFFRKEVLKLHGNVCDRCGTDGKSTYRNVQGKILSNPLSIHHKSYDWDCDYYIKKGQRIIKSDCQTCCARGTSVLDSAYQKFQKCIDMVEVLCNRCHYKEHKRLLKNTGNWFGVKINKIE